MLQFESKGSFRNTESFLNRAKNGQIFAMLDRYGQEGVDALANATPIDTSETQHSWYYEVQSARGQYSIVFRNSHMVEGVSIAMIIQYGHGTGTGGYVQGRDYINPAIRPIFDRILADVWKAVTR